MIKIITAVASTMALIASFYMGYYKRGEIEAVKTSKAYEKAVQETSNEWQDKLDKAVINAQEEALSRAKTKIITKKVKVYVKENPNTRQCYDANQLLLVTESLGNT